MKGFILAAGFGTRMGNLTSDCPKPLLPLGGYPLIYYSLYRLYRWQVDACVINIHYLADKIKKCLKNFPHFPLHFSFEKEILGTAGGIRHAQNCGFLDGDDSFILLNPDTVLLPTANDAPKSRHINLKSLSHLFLMPRSDNSLTGLNMDANHIVTFHPQGTYYYPGYALISGQLVSDLPDHKFASLGPLWKSAAQINKLHGQKFQGQILDAGSEQAYLRIRETFPLTENESASWQEFLAGWH